MTPAPASRRDSLALPPVPPPAPDAHPWRDRVVVALFVFALVIPMAGTWLKRDLEVTEFEKRRTVAWPATPRTVTAIGTWPPAFEAAIADRFGGRDALIALHHFAKTVIFGVSPVPNVLIGRDGWLFFLGEDGKSIDRDYRGVIPYAPDEPMRVAAELKRRHDYLAARGIAYVVVVVPDKSTIYPEYLPSWVTRVQGGTRLDRFYSALREYPDLKVLDLRPALIEAKTRERQYFKTDSHWNYLGATTGYELLIGAVKSLVPSVPAVPAERPPYQPGVDYWKGDLTMMLGLPTWLAEDDIAPMAKVVGDDSRRCARAAATPFPAGMPKPAEDTVVFVCENPQLPVALVYFDSMAELFMPQLSENFRRIVYVASRRLDQALVEREKPDVVIEEFVERSLHAPAALPM
jgi:hypothetical protein